MEKMELEEFANKINEIRAKNGWMIELELNGLWIVSVYDKETNELLAHTGSTGLYGVYAALTKPLDHTIWSH